MNNYDYTITFNTKKINLTLTKCQSDLLENQKNRYFIFKVSQFDLNKKIDSATRVDELEKLCKDFYICDYSKFENLNLSVVKSVLKSVVDCLYKYPALRGMLCYIGTSKGIETELTKLSNGDLSVLKDFNLSYILNPQNAINYANFVLSLKDFKNMNNVYAYYWDLTFFKMFVINENYFDNFAIEQTLKECKRKNQIKFFDYAFVESVAYHELAHALDALCECSSSKQFVELKNSLSSFKIKFSLSNYALTNNKEFFAEAFSEYMCTDSPRLIAQKVKQILDEIYQKLYS